MTHFSEELKKQASIIRLTDTERDSIRARLFGEPTSVPVRSPYVFTFSYFSYSRGIAFALSFVLIITGAGGTLYAAEDTLPGDLLYSVKTSISEPLSGALVSGEEAETSWHETIATKRLTEAEALARDGRLTDEVSAKLAVAFEAHASKVRTADANVSENLSSAETDSRADTRADAKERFRALVAAKGASILEASITGDGTEGRIASAHFVLSVLDDETPEENEKSTVASGARMGKQSAPVESDAPVSAHASTVMATMAFVPPTPSGEAANTKRAFESNEDDLETLGKDAKRAFEDARKVVESQGSPIVKLELSHLLPILVRADAEAVTGADTDARTHYVYVIENARAIKALFSQDMVEDSRDGEQEDANEATNEDDVQDANDDEYRSFFYR